MDKDLKLKCDKPVLFLKGCRSWNETRARKIITQSTPKSPMFLFFSSFPSTVLRSFQISPTTVADGLYTNMCSVTRNCLNITTEIFKILTEKGEKQW